MEYEIIRFDRPDRAEVRGSGRLFRWISTFDFTATAGGTRVHCTLDPHPRGVFRVLTPLMSGMVQKQMETGLASLRETIHRKPVADGGTAG
jgi:hypothetical protein